MSELPTRSAPVAAARSTAMVKSAMTRTMPRSALFGLRDIADSPPRLEVGERAVADGDLRLGDRGDGCRQARVRVRKVRPDRDAHLGDAVALLRGEVRRRAGRNQLVRWVRAVEVAGVEGGGGGVVDERDGRRAAGGAAGGAGGPG